MSVKWEYVSINNRKVQVDTCADSTVISSKIWTELRKSQLGGKIRHLEAYDGNQLTLLGSLTCDVEWHRSRLRQKQLAVVQCDKKFGLLVREILHKHGVYHITTEHLLAVGGCKAQVKLIPGSQPMFCTARKILLPLQDKVTEKLEQMVRQCILEPVQPGGVTNATPVLCQRKKSRELRFCVDLKVHIKGKVMDEDYPIPDMETIFHNPHGASYSVKIDLSDAYYQFELDEGAKDISTINTSRGLFKMCQLPQWLKNSSSIFQNCIESTQKGIKGVLIFQDDLLVYGATKEQFDKRMLDVKSRLRGGNCTRFQTVWKKNPKAPTKNKQLESFVGLAKKGRMVLGRLFTLQMGHKPLKYLISLHQTKKSRS